MCCPVGTGGGEGIKVSEGVLGESRELGGPPRIPTRRQGGVLKPRWWVCHQALATALLSPQRVGCSAGTQSKALQRIACFTPPTWCLALRSRKAVPRPRRLRCGGGGPDDDARRSRAWRPWRRWDTWTPPNWKQNTAVFLGGGNGGHFRLQLEGSGTRLKERPKAFEAPRVRLREDTGMSFFLTGSNGTGVEHGILRDVAGKAASRRQ